MAYVDRWVSVGIRHYFEASYGLLTGSPEGRRFLHLAAPVPGVVAHGYTTADDLSAVVRSLDAGASGRLLDLGCGLGGIALEVNRRTGAFVTGASQTESPVPITRTVPTSHSLSSEAPTLAIAAPAVTATTRPPAM